MDSSELRSALSGNASRNTEGSGLGLALPKALRSCRRAMLELDVDGILFKVNEPHGISWRRIVYAVTRLRCEGNLE